MTIGATPLAEPEVSSISDPLLVNRNSPAVLEEVESDNDPANRSILSAAANWRSAVVEVVPLLNIIVDAPARIKIPVVLCATIPFPTKLWVPSTSIS
jgi:hypothetical protein